MAKATIETQRTVTLVLTEEEAAVVQILAQKGASRSAERVAAVLSDVLFDQSTESEVVG